MKSLKDKKEQVIKSYQKTFDLDLAYKKIGITKEEKAELEKDEVFQSRVQFFLIEEREKIISVLRDLMTSENEAIAFKAVTEIARVLYPDFYEAKEAKNNVNVNVNVNEKNTPEENKRIESEYLHVLNGKEFKTK